MAALGYPMSNQNMKGAVHETSCSVQFHDQHALQGEGAGVAKSVMRASVCSATLVIDRYLPRHDCLPVALIFCSLPFCFQVGASMVPTASREVFWAKRNCRTAEYSEYLGISRISRVIFFPHDTKCASQCLSETRIRVRTAHKARVSAYQ